METRVSVNFIFNLRLFFIGTLHLVFKKNLLDNIFSCCVFHLSKQCSLPIIRQNLQKICKKESEIFGTFVNFGKTLRHYSIETLLLFYQKNLRDNKFFKLNVYNILSHQACEKCIKTVKIGFWCLFVSFCGSSGQLKKSKNLNKTISHKTKFTPHGIPWVKPFNLVLNLNMANFVKKTRLIQIFSFPI